MLTKVVDTGASDQELPSLGAHHILEKYVS